MSNGNNFPNMFGKSSNPTGTTNTTGQTQNSVFGSGVGGGFNLMGNQSGFGVNQGAYQNGQNPSGGIPTTNPFSGGVTLGAQNKTGSNPPAQSSLFNPSTSGVNFNLNANKPLGTEKVENSQNELNKALSFGPINPMNSINPPIKESSQESSESKPATFNSLTGQTGQATNSLFNLNNNASSGLLQSNPTNSENKPGLFSNLTSKPEKIVVPTGNGNTVNTDSAKPQSMQWGSAFNTDKSKSQSVFPGLGTNVGGSTTGNFLIPNKEGQGDNSTISTIPTNSTLFGNSSNTSQIPSKSPFTGIVTNSTNPTSINPEDKKEVVLEANKTQLGGGLFGPKPSETTTNTTNTTNTASNQVNSSNVVNNNPTNTSNVVNNNPINTSNSSLNVNLNSTGTTNQSTSGININKPPTNTTSNNPTLTTTTTASNNLNPTLTTTTSNNLLTDPVRSSTTNVVPNPEKKPDGPNIKTSEMFSRKDDVDVMQRLMDAEVNGLMKKSIEDVINKWKSDLDQQVQSFNSCGDALIQSEESFLRQFDFICNLHELINNLKEEANREMKRLAELEAEQDNILEKMDIMEDRLDSYLQMLDKSSGPSAVPGDTHNVHQSVQEIVKIVGDVQKDIDESDKKISESTQDGSGRNQNEFTTILNSHYNALRSVQFMEQHLLTQMAAFEEELNRRNLEKTR